MKRLIAILLCLSTPSWGVIAPVAHTAQGSTNATNVTTSGIDTSGSTLLSVVVTDYAILSLGTLTDSNGNTWHSLTSSPGSVLRTTLWYSYDHSGSALSVGASHTFTYTCNGGQACYPDIAVATFSGTLTTGDPSDQQATATGTGFAIAGPITPSVDNEVLITGSGTSVNGTPIVDAYYTTTDALAYLAGSYWGNGSAYAVQTTATSKSASWNNSGGQQDAVIASFKQGTAAPVIISSGTTLPLMGI